jgi:DNA adenine methylase
MNNILKPPIKWVGGKTQILCQLLTMFPKSINNYYEPFLGSGSVLLAILSSKDIHVKGEIYVSDVNLKLIELYKNIKTSPVQLYEHLQELKNNYSNSKDKENFYYDMRAKYNHNTLNTIEKSALFLFLNKTCFRGLYREGPNGFNVPFGHYAKPAFVTKEHILSISQNIQRVHFIHCSFEEILQNPKPGDFVYLDPPYMPVISSSFVRYTKSGFGDEQHSILFKLCHELKNNRVDWILSNSNIEKVKKHFEGLIIKEIICKRYINSKNPESESSELIISNMCA